MAEGVDLVRVGHLPGTASIAVIVTPGLASGRQFCLLSVEGIAVEILLAADFARTHCCIDLEDGVVGSINVWIDTQAEAKYHVSNLL